MVPAQDFPQESGLIQTVVLSPREDQIAASLGIFSGQLVDVWIYDLHKNAKAKLTFNQHSYTPIRLDGSRVVFDRVSPDGDELVVKDVSGRGSEEGLFKLGRENTKAESGSTPQRLYPLAWSRDGKYLLYREGRTDIRALSLTGEPKSTLLLTSVTQIIVHGNARNNGPPVVPSLTGGRPNGYDVPETRCGCECSGR